MNSQILLSRESKENVISLTSAEFAHCMASVENHLRTTNHIDLHFYYEK